MPAVAPKRIVMLCDLYDDNAQYRENLLTKYYRKHGHAVTVVASTIKTARDFYAHRYDATAPATETWIDGARIIKRPYAFNALNRFRRFAGVYELFEQERPDLIVANDVHLNLIEAVRYARAHPECRVIMGSSTDYTNSGRNWISLNVLHRIVRGGLLRVWRPKICRFYPVTPETIRFLREVYGVPDSEMELLPLGSDTDLANAIRASDARQVMRSALGIPESAVTVFTGGKLEPLKKTHLLMEAVRIIDDPNLHVIVVGDDDQQGAYRRRLEELCGHDPRVHFVGWVSGADVYRYMAASDIGVFPGSQSVLWQQALSTGLPLVVAGATDWGDQDPSYMNLYDNMIILTRDEIRGDVVATHLRALLADSVRRKRMQAMALRVSDEMLDYDRIVERTLSVCP